MLIHNRSPNSIRILSADKGPLNEFIQNTAVGKILKGKVLDVLAGGKALVDFGGKKLTVETSGALTKGQTILARVQQLSPTLVLKLINPSIGESAPARAGTPDIISSLSTTRPSNAGLQNAAFAEKASLSAANLLALKLEPGQTLKGTLVRILDDKMALVQFQNRQLQTLMAGGNVNLRPGQEIAATVQRLGSGFALIAQPMNAGLRAVDAAMIKPYLTSKQDLGKMIVSLRKAILENPALKDLKIDPALIERIRDTLKILLPTEETLRDGARLKEQIDRSGINYEAKVRRLLAQKQTLDNRAVLAKDLKGQLLELLGRLEKLDLKKIQRDSFAPDRSQEIKELIQHVKQAVDSLEHQQLSNQFARQKQDPILIQIPDPFSPETKTAKLYIRGDAEGEGGARKDKKDVNLVFLLDLTALGNLRVDAKLREKDLSAKISVEDNAVADFIANRVQKLESRLREIGFNASVTCCFKEKVETEVEENLKRELMRDPSRLVDIET